MGAEGGMKGLDKKGMKGRLGKSVLQSCCIGRSACVVVRVVCGLNLLVLVWDEHIVRVSGCLYMFHHQG